MHQSESPTYLRTNSVKFEYCLRRAIPGQAGWEAFEQEVRAAGATQTLAWMSQTRPLMDHQWAIRDPARPHSIGGLETVFSEAVRRLGERRFVFRNRERLELVFDLMARSTWRRWRPSGGPARSSERGCSPTVDVRSERAGHSTTTGRRRSTMPSARSKRGSPAGGAEREGVARAPRSSCRSRPAAHEDAIPTSEAAANSAALTGVSR